MRREEAFVPAERWHRASRGGGEDGQRGGNGEASGRGHPHRRVPIGEEGGVDEGGEGGPVGGLVEGRAGDGHHHGHGRDEGVGLELVHHPGLEAEEVGGQHHHREGVGGVPPGVAREEVPDAVGAGAPAAGGLAEGVLRDLVGGAHQLAEGIGGRGGEAAAVQVEQRVGREGGRELQGEASLRELLRGGGTASNPKVEGGGGAGGRGWWEGGAAGWRGRTPEGCRSWRRPGG